MRFFKVKCCPHCEKPFGLLTRLHVNCRRSRVCRTCGGEFTSAFSNVVLVYSVAIAFALFFSNLAQDRLGTFESLGLMAVYIFCCSYVLGKYERY